MAPVARREDGPRTLLSAARCRGGGGSRAPLRCARRQDRGRPGLRPRLVHRRVPCRRRPRDPGGQRSGGTRAGRRPSGRRADRRRRRPAARGRERGRSLLLEPARAHAQHARRDCRNRAHPQARGVGLHLLDELVLTLGWARHDSVPLPRTAPRPPPLSAPPRAAAQEPIRRRTVAGACGAHAEARAIASGTRDRKGRAALLAAPRIHHAHPARARAAHLELRHPRAEACRRSVLSILPSATISSTTAATPTQWAPRCSIAYLLSKPCCPWAGNSR